MPPLDDKNSSIAFRNERNILKALERIGHDTVAKAGGVEESYISKLKSKEQKINYESFSRQLAAMGLQVVPARHLCVDKETLKNHMDMLKRLADIGFKEINRQGIEVFEIKEDLFD